MTDDFSYNFKIKMNRLFREQVGINHAVHPEVDNVYERVRSKIVRKFLVLKNKLVKRK